MNWDEIEEKYGHNVTTYSCPEEERAIEKPWTVKERKRFVKCCANCTEYDGNRCMKEWNNADPDYYVKWRDDKEADDVCEDWEFYEGWEE